MATQSNDKYTTRVQTQDDRIKKQHFGTKRLNRVK